MRQITRYEYDEAGRVAASVSEADPDWLEEDRDWVLALLAEQREICPGCGHPLEVCRDPATQGTWRLISSQCEACRVLEADADNQRESTARIRGRYTAAVQGT